MNVTTYREEQLTLGLNLPMYATVQLQLADYNSQLLDLLD